MKKIAITFALALSIVAGAVGVSALVSTTASTAHACSTPACG